MIVMDWLLDSDPAIRWQVLRDLAGAGPEVVDAERARVAREGWGARLLALQDAGGGWAAGGACFPGRGYRHTGPDHEAPPDGEDGQPWVSTLPTLDVLVELGVDPADARVQKAVAAVRDTVRWEYDDLPFFDGEVEACINGRTVRIGAYFGQPVDGIVERLLREQYADGGWNCELQNGAKVSSFASTINVLDGLLTYQQAGGALRRRSRPPARRGIPARARALPAQVHRRGGRRRLAQLLVPVPLALRRAARPRLLPGHRANRPTRDLREAVELVQRKQQHDGTWLLENTHPGLVFFSLEDGDGQPSRWNTLRALRVLAGLRARPTRTDTRRPPTAPGPGRPA